MRQGGQRRGRGTGLGRWAVLSEGGSPWPPLAPGGGPAGHSDGPQGAGVAPWQRPGRVQPMWQAGQLCWRLLVPGPWGLLSPNSPERPPPGPLQAGRGEPAPRPCPCCAAGGRLSEGPGPAVPASRAAPGMRAHCASLRVPCLGGRSFSPGPHAGACVTEHRGQWVTGPGSTQVWTLQAQEEGASRISRYPGAQPAAQVS